MKNYLLLLLAISAIAQTHAQTDTDTAALSLTTLPYFQAQPVDNVVLLKWSVEQFDEYKSFDIERADGESSFSKIGSKLAISLGSNQGYDFVDATPKQNTVLRYRLKLINKNGSVVYSAHQEIKSAGAQFVLRLKQNPVRSNIELELTAPSAKQATVTIVSGTGQQAASQTIRLSTGLNAISLPAQALRPGIYQMSVEAGNERKAISFIKE